MDTKDKKLRISKAKQRTIIQTAQHVLTMICGLPLRKRLKVIWLILRKKPTDILLKFLYNPSTGK